MKDHVPTVETCQKLKEAGFQQDSYFSYWKNGMGDVVLWDETEVSDYQTMVSAKLCAAPILTEILEQLPKTAEDKRGIFGWGGFALFRTIHGNEIGYVHIDDETGVFEGMAPMVKKNNPAEAAALLWLELNTE